MRINLIGAAGSGKSKTAGFLYSNLNHQVELVREYIKSWAYIGRKPKGFDQFYIFGKQLHAEDSLLQNGVNHIVTDSPLILSCAYAKKYDFPCWRELVNICLEFEKTFPSLNIFLDRTGIEYQQNGRYENHQESLAMDQEIICLLQEFDVKYTIMPTLNKVEILSFVKASLTGNGSVVE